MMVHRLFQGMGDIPQDVARELAEEIVANDPVVKNVGYRYFISRSKGRRNGKQRIRRKWKEVELIRYQDGFHYPHRAKLDCITTELTGEQLDGDAILWHIRDYCRPDGGGNGVL